MIPPLRGWEAETPWFLNTNRGVIRRVLPVAKAAPAQIVGQVMNRRNFIDYVNRPGVSYNEMLVMLA